MKTLALTDSSFPWHSFNIRFGQYSKDLELPITISRDVNKIDFLTAGETLIFYRFDPLWGDLAQKLSIASSRGIKIISDIDDLLWQAPGWPQARLKGLTNALRECHIITCSTTALKELLTFMFPNQTIILIPNSTPPKRKRNRQPRYSKLRLCWTGAPWTRPKDLEILKPLSTWLNQQNIPISWRHIGHCEGRLSFAEAIGINPNDVEILPLLPHQDYLNSIEGDIGLAPLSNGAFNSFKSEIKLLEFSGLGIPWIASSSPPYNALCKRWSLSGRLCKEPEEWITHFKSLMNPNLRKQEGEKLQQLSHQLQSHNQAVMQWREILTR